MINFNIIFASCWIGICSVLFLAMIACIRGVTEFRWGIGEFVFGFAKLFSIGIPVAIIEELIFRIFPSIAGWDNPITIILSSLLFSGVHFWWGMYKNNEDERENFMLFVGLFILGACLYLINIKYAFANVGYHAGIITGVSITAQLFRKEVFNDRWAWDEGHRLIRTPLSWFVMIIGTIGILSYYG